MGYIRLRRRQFWSAGASEARPRFASLGPESGTVKAPSQLRFAGALQKSRVSPILRTLLYARRVTFQEPPVASKFGARQLTAANSKRYSAKESTAPSNPWIFASTD